LKIGFIGLGRMGSRMAERLLKKRHKLVLYARDQKSLKPFEKKGAVATKSYAEFAEKLGNHKIIFIMVPQGRAVNDVIKKLFPFLFRGDIIIDGGNSFYKDSMSRAKKLAKKGVSFLDVGISGGLDGAKKGASIMVGGKKSAFKKTERLFKDLAVKNGYAWVGESGAGHFVKMIHNGIEYSLLQSYAEGYALLEKSRFNIDLLEVTRVYMNGSVIRSWLINLLALALKKDPKLKSQTGIIGGGTTGKWALNAAKEYKFKMPMLKYALIARKRSHKNQDFSSKVVSALRLEFGGHLPPKK